MEFLRFPDVEQPEPLIPTSPPEPVAAGHLSFSDLVLDGSLPRVTVNLIDRPAQSSRPLRSADSLLTELQCEV